MQADLEAQVAACAAGHDGLLALDGEVGSDVLTAQLAHLQDQGEHLVRDVLNRLSEIGRAHV